MVVYRVCWEERDVDGEPLGGGCLEFDELSEAFKAFREHEEWMKSKEGPDRVWLEIVSVPIERIRGDK